nr:hypothetical protein [Tanacetum cinerariifolium]
MNDIFDDSSNDPLLEEVDLFLASDNLIPPGIRNIDDNLEGDIRFLEELHIDDSIPNPVNESSDFDNQDDPLFLRSPPEPPDVEFDFEPEIFLLYLIYPEVSPFLLSVGRFNPTMIDVSRVCTTTQSDISLPEYDSFIYDLSNDQFPPIDRSAFTHEEFDDEPAHIISPPEYDCFYFRDLPNSGELISSLNSGIRENLSSTTCANLPVEDNYSPLLAYVVWIFLAYLMYPVIPPHLHSFGNEDTIFDPGITINRFYSFKPGLSHRCGTFREFNTHRSHLNESPMDMLFSTLFPMDQ